MKYLYNTTNKPIVYQGITIPPMTSIMLNNEGKIIDEISEAGSGSGKVSGVVAEEVEKLSNSYDSLSNAYSCLRKQYYCLCSDVCSNERKYQCLCSDVKDNYTKLSNELSSQKSCLSNVESNTKKEIDNVKCLYNKATTATEELKGNVTTIQEAVCKQGSRLVTHDTCLYQQSVCMDELDKHIGSIGEDWKENQRLYNNISDRVSNTEIRLGKLPDEIDKAISKTFIFTTDGEVSQLNIEVDHPAYKDECGNIFYQCHK